MGPAVLYFPETQRLDSRSITRPAHDTLQYIRLTKLARSSYTANYIRGLHDMFHARYTTCYIRVTRQITSRWQSLHKGITRQITNGLHWNVTYGLYMTCYIGVIHDTLHTGSPIWPSDPSCPDKPLGPYGENATVTHCKRIAFQLPVGNRGLKEKSDGAARSLTGSPETPGGPRGPGGAGRPCGYTENIGSQSITNILNMS